MKFPLKASLLSFFLEELMENIIPLFSSILRDDRLIQPNKLIVVNKEISSRLLKPNKFAEIALSHRRWVVNRKANLG